MSSSDFINSIFLGEVCSVHPYGAFIQIPGRKQQGLVHKSQISQSHIDEASDVLQKGDKVWCKVIGVADDGKISLSMKFVNQGSGKDLDPSGTQAHQDEVRRKARPKSHRLQPIRLEAVLNTTCSKCKTKGHLAKDCFRSLDGRTYELLPDEDDEPPLPTSTKAEDNLKSKKKKKKGDKKKRKKRRRERSYSSSSSSSSRSSSSSSAPECKKRRKKECKRKKERGRSRSPQSRRFKK